MVAIPKISLGKKSKRSYFNLTHDVNTTSDFGFCQPTICREFYKDSKISLKSKQFVRLGAMPCPTFGRIEVRTHTAFVPVNDVFLGYDYLQSQKTVTSANRSYIPQCADYITANTLLGSCLDLVFDTPNYFTHFADASDLVTHVDETKFLGRFSLWLTWGDFCNGSHPLYGEHGVNDWIDICNDPVVISDSTLMTNAVKVVMGLMTANPGNTEITVSPFYTMLQNNSHFKRPSIGKMDCSSGQARIYFNKLWAVNFCHYTAGRSLPTTTGMNGYEKAFAESFTDMYYLDKESDFLQPLSYENYDFDFGSLDLNYQDVWNISKTYVPCKIRFHLSKTGRRLFKVFTGCRVSFGTKEKKIDLMRLLSYYKVWFDKYNPGRNLQWLDTNAFGLIHSYYDYGSVLDNVINLSGADYSRIYSAGILDRYYKFWYCFLLDLPQCCYVLLPDNMTCATSTPLLEVTDNSSDVTDLQMYYSNNSVLNSADANLDSSRVYGDANALQDAGGLGVQLLNRIYHLVNKNSVIGSKIDEYLRAHNISRGLPHSNVLGDSDFMCNIDDVFATAGTSESALGEYAGKGIGSGSSDTMHFETECFGYLIQLLCVVPMGGYVQGMRDCPIERFDFYQSEFDSLGMEPMSKSNFINRRYNYDTFDSSDTVFGFRPRYFGLKFENNLANGGFSLHSQQAQFLPYCLDRIFSIRQTSIQTEDYVADEALRYIGRYEKFGNYDRIFYDVTGQTDNFIVHMIQDFSMYAPMKPISDSYDTFDKDVDDTSINVQKS